MIEALDTITGNKGSNIFLFADQERFAADGPLNLKWISEKREAARITD